MLSAEEGLRRLVEGNKRFVSGKARFPTVCKETLAALAKGQQPFATILGCADSRVPPEGHQGCGAVKAALESKAKGATHLSRIQVLVNNIVPGLSGMNHSHPSSEDRLAEAVEANVRWSKKQLMETPEGKQAARQGHKKLVGAVFEIDSGRVRFL